MKNRKIIISSLFFILQILFIIISVDVVAGITVVPSSIILSPNSRTESMTLYNNSDSPAEVSIFLGDFLPNYKIAGEFMPDIMDSLYQQNAHFINNWLRIFPGSATLAPGTSQAIRFIANKPLACAIYQEAQKHEELKMYEFRKWALKRFPHSIFFRLTNETLSKFRYG